MKIALPLLASAALAAGTGATAPGVLSVPPAFGDVWAAAVAPKGPPLRPGVLAEGTYTRIFEAIAGDAWQQVRIEQRVVIRITPRDPGREVAMPQALTIQLQPRQPSFRVRERRMSNCMPAMGIAAVQPITDGRLLFYMRDRRLIAANLEKMCSARDFYLGFYMTKTTDGQLCVNRDEIHSRAGTTCMLQGVRELVPTD